MSAGFAFSPRDMVTSSAAGVTTSAPDAGHAVAQARTYMGFTPFALFLVLLAILAVAWGAWTTREILELRDRKIVSVSLTAIMKQFVAAEAQRPQSQDSARTRTLAFLQGVDTSIQALAAEGHIVLLSEAVAGQSVPDATPAVMAIVASRMSKVPASGDPGLSVPEGSSAPEAVGGAGQ
jgi:hypothetical protein